MIAKRTPRRRDSRSSYPLLANYILAENEKRPQEKVLYSRCTNTQSQEPALAIKEIEATQALNQRAKSDKTYHLVVSFREGERPSRDQLDAIEQHLCEALGFGDHQRLSAVHANTDHLHIHIAINKVHPVSHRLITPHRDFYKLSTACRKLEQRFGLQVDNGMPGADRIAARARDLEAHQGLESFQRWAQAEPRQRLMAALDRPDASWASLHAALADYHLTVKPRGAGLVVADRDRPAFAVKASQLGRRFSKDRLESRLGPYEPPAAGLAFKPTARYRPRPFARQPDTRQLWQRYTREREARSAARQEALDKLSAERRAAFKALNRHFRKRRAFLHARQAIRGREKRAAYSLLRMERALTELALRRRFHERRRRIVAQHKGESWLDYLQRLARDGDLNALAALRRAEQRRDRPEGHYVQGADPKREPAALFAFRYQIHRNGDVTYFLAGGVSFTDEGRRLRLGERWTTASLEAALTLARAQFGPRLTLRGSDPFKQAAAQLAGRLNLPIEFTDPALEHERRSQTRAVHTRRDPIDVYIEQRNALVSRVKDLLPHRRYTAADAGIGVYRGQRHLGGQTVALFERQGTMLVRPVSEQAAAQLRRIRIGSRIHIEHDSHDRRRGQELDGHGL